MPRSSWMIAFADLAAVLVGFFVLVLSMSEFDTPAVEELLDRLGRREGEWMARPVEVIDPDIAMLRAESQAITDPAYLTTVLRQRARESGWPVHVRQENESVVLTLKEDETIRADDPVPAAVGDLGRYLGIVGYRTEVAMIYPESRRDRALGFGVYDTGLAAANQVVLALRAGGLDGPVPIVSRIDGSARDTRREIRVTLPDASMGAIGR